MADNTVKGTKKLNSSNTTSNSVRFLIDQKIRDTLNTAELVSIKTADPQGTDSTGGYAAATPLVARLDNFNNVTPVATLHKLPFYRPQAGKAAILMEPQPGDKALAVAVKSDSTAVKVDTTEPVGPASFRHFDQADSFLLNGFLGEAPEIWLKLDPVSGDISLSTKEADIDISVREEGNIDITTKVGNIGVRCLESGDIEVAAKAGNIMVKTEAGNTWEEATGTVTKKCPLIVLDGNVRITGDLAIEGRAGGLNGGPAVFRNGLINQNGGFSNAGGISNTGGLSNQGGLNNEGGVLRSNNVTLEGHLHNGVLPGGFQSGGPVQGT